MLQIGGIRSAAERMLDPSHLDGLGNQRCSPLRLKARCSANSARRLPGRGRASSASKSASSSTGPCCSAAAGCRLPCSKSAATEAASSSNVECTFMLLHSFGGLDALTHDLQAGPDNPWPIDRDLGWRRPLSQDDRREAGTLA